MKTPYLFLTVVCIFLFTQCRKSAVSYPESHEAPDVQLKLRSGDVRMPLKEQDTTISFVLPFEFNEVISRIVKPAKEALFKILEDDETGLFKAYTADIEKLKEVKSAEERTELLAHINKQYHGFMLTAWEKAGINDELYKRAIIRALPDSLRESIAFEPNFLNFKIQYGRLREPLPSDDGQPDPAAPSLQCYNALKAITGGAHKFIALTASGDAAFLRNVNQPDSYFLFNNALAFPIYGLVKTTAWTNNTISIPGTFLNDDKRVRVKKQFTWNGTVTAASGGVLARANASVGTMLSFKLVDIWAPVIWFAEQQLNMPLREEYTTVKTRMDLLQNGAITQNNATCTGLAGASAITTLSINEWILCEQPPK